MGGLHRACCCGGGGYTPGTPCAYCPGGAIAARYLMQLNDINPTWCCGDFGGSTSTLTTWVGPTALVLQPAAGNPCMKQYTSVRWWHYDGYNLLGCAGPVTGSGDLYSGVSLAFHDFGAGLVARLLIGQPFPGTFEMPWTAVPNCIGPFTFNNIWAGCTLAYGDVPVPHPASATITAI